MACYVINFYNFSTRTRKNCVYCMYYSKDKDVFVLLIFKSCIAQVFSLPDGGLLEYTSDIVDWLIPFYSISFYSIYIEILLLVAKKLLEVLSGAVSYFFFI